MKTEIISGSVSRIRDQLRTNLGHFLNPARETLDILQSHIEDQLREIERHAGLTPAGGVVEASASMDQAIARIREQMRVNLGYFATPGCKLLRSLQAPIEAELRVILQSTA